MKLTSLVAQARVDSPLGPITLAATGRGLAGLWFDGQAHYPDALNAPADAAQPFIAQAAAELQRYWQRDLAGGFQVPLELQGTLLQRAVWRALLDIPRGCTRSYTQLAIQAGAGHAVRAVAGAVARNPLSIIVPCHRVLGRDGALTGYAGGLERKRALLALEGAVPG